jgi:pimeloyl-ACP methyl ester carboxylesterase
MALMGGGLALTARGLYLKKKMQDPFDSDALRNDGGKFVITKGGGASDDGRVIEYFVWGSEQKDAKVVVLCHGSAGTAKTMMWLYKDDLLKELNVKAIGITYPGHGYSDCQIPRQIVNWPNDDVQPILEQEGVTQFTVQGWSYGTAHAMACGVYFPPDVCVAVGLNCPFLSNPVCVEFGLSDNLAALPTVAQVNQPWNAAIFALLDIFTKPLISQGLKWLPEGKCVSEDHPELLEMMPQDICRGCVRGTSSQAYDEYTVDITGMWGFDPRDIQTKYIAVWYAEDDSAVPPSHGKWLVDTFGAMSHVQKLDVRNPKTGHGHCSHVLKANLKDGIQTKVLLDIAGSQW